MIASPVVPNGKRQSKVLPSKIASLPNFDTLESKKAGPFSWLTSSRAFVRAQLTGGNKERVGIAIYDLPSGERSTLIRSETLNGLPVEAVQVSEDESKILLLMDAQKVWRDKTKGSFSIFDRKNETLQAVGPVDSRPDLQFGKLSPSGATVAYYFANNIFVQELESGETRQLTFDGSENIINGSSDWVYEEELHLRDCFQWSPDGNDIAYLQFDVGAEHEFTLSWDTGTLYPAHRKFVYPKVGTRNASVRLGIASSSGGPTKWLTVQASPDDGYIASFKWIPDSREIIVQRVNREQNRNDVITVEVDSGRVRNVFSDTSDTWVDVVDGFHWFDGGKQFLWTSERDGWRHLYSVSRESGELQQITRGHFDVISIVGLDGSVDDARNVYFIASPDDATQRYLYRAPLDGSRTIERITPNVRGAHAYELAPWGGAAVHTWSSFNQPSVSELITLPDHKTVATLTDNSDLLGNIYPSTGSGVVRQAHHDTTGQAHHDATGQAHHDTTGQAHHDTIGSDHTQVEFFKVEVDGVELDGWMMKPTDFDPSQKYPLIMYVYGEPAASTIVDQWGGNTAIFHRHLVQIGYLVASVDNRGTASPRGKAWRASVFGSIGPLAAHDQASALKQLLETLPYIDAERVGVWGHSGGGSNTLHLLFRYPELYKAGVSLAPVPDKALYDTIYQERYMRTPESNPDGYRESSPINFAEGLKGNLLLIHGSGDDNCHLQGTERLMNRLIELGKEFDVMIYPGRSHSLDEGKGTKNHLYALMTRFFTTHLPLQSLTLGRGGSIPHHDIPIPHHDIPIPHHDIPIPHHDIPIPHHDIPIPHHDTTADPVSESE